MQLYANKGRRAVSAVLSLKPLLAFDFDGTLAPIVARPDDVRVLRTFRVTWPSWPNGDRWPLSGLRCRAVRWGRCE